MLSISRWSSARLDDCSRSSIGMIPLSGVRTSWLIVARNSPLASTADSAICLASVNSLCRRRYSSISCRKASNSAVLATVISSAVAGSALSALTIAADLACPISRITIKNATSPTLVKPSAVSRHNPVMPARSRPSTATAPIRVAAVIQRSRTRVGCVLAMGGGCQSTAVLKSKSIAPAAPCTRLPWM